MIYLTYRDQMLFLWARLLVYRTLPFCFPANRQKNKSDPVTYKGSESKQARAGIQTMLFQDSAWFWMPSHDFREAWLPDWTAKKVDSAEIIYSIKWVGRKNTWLTGSGRLFWRNQVTCLCYSINCNETTLASQLLALTFKQCYFSISYLQAFSTLSIVSIFLLAETCLGIAKIGTKEVLVRASQRWSKAPATGLLGLGLVYSIWFLALCSVFFPTHIERSIPWGAS